MLFRPSLISAQLLIVDSVHALTQCNTLTLTCPCHVVDASAVVSVYRAANCRLRQCHQKPIPRWSHRQWKTAKCILLKKWKGSKIVPVRYDWETNNFTTLIWNDLLSIPLFYYTLFWIGLGLDSACERVHCFCNQFVVADAVCQCHLSSISAQFIIVDLVPLVIFIRHVDIWHYIVNSISHHTTE